MTNPGLDRRFSHPGQNHGRITRAEMIETILDLEGIPTPSDERFARGLDLWKLSTSELRDRAGIVQ